MGVALHTYILDRRERVIARVTTYGANEDAATEVLDDIDYDDRNEISILEEDVTPPDAEAMFCKAVPSDWKVASS